MKYESIKNFLKYILVTIFFTVPIIGGAVFYFREIPFLIAISVAVGTGAMGLFFGKYLETVFQKNIEHLKDLFFLFTFSALLFLTFTVFRINEGEQKIAFFLIPAFALFLFFRRIFSNV